MPKPLKFPLKFKVFLRLIIGGRLHSERLHIFRNFWCAMLKKHYELGSYAGFGDDNTTNEGRQNMTANMVEKYNRDGVDELNFNRFKADITCWRNRNRIEQRRNAAKCRWEKQSAKKSLDAIKKQGK
jgi:hypothetical protein